MNDERLGEQSAKNVEEERAFQRRHLARKLDAVGWGLFFI